MISEFLDATMMCEVIMNKFLSVIMECKLIMREFLAVIWAHCGMS